MPNPNPLLLKANLYPKFGIHHSHTSLNNFLIKKLSINHAEYWVTCFLTLHKWHYMVCVLLKLALTVQHIDVRLTNVNNASSRSLINAAMYTDRECPPRKCIHTFRKEKTVLKL